MDVRTAMRPKGNSAAALVGKKGSSRMTGEGFFSLLLLSLDASAFAGTTVTGSQRRGSPGTQPQSSRESSVSPLEASSAQESGRRPL